jgi:hypothetical protein
VAADTISGLVSRCRKRSSMFIMFRNRMGHGTDHGESSCFHSLAYRQISSVHNFSLRGICFTYATMFALESLSLAGETYNNSASVRKACEFLVKHQMVDGGWGETYMASSSRHFISRDTICLSSRCVRSPASPMYTRNMRHHKWSRRRGLSLHYSTPDIRTSR